MNYLKAAVKLGLLVGLLGVSQAGWADCRATSLPGSKYATYILPDSSVGIPIGVATGTGPIGPVYEPPSLGANIVGTSCSAGTTFTLLKFGTPLTVSNYSNDIYETNIPGIGVKVWSDYINTITISNSLQAWYNYPSPGHHTGRGAWLTGVKLQFYITGPVSFDNMDNIKISVLIDEWMNDRTDTTAGGLFINRLTINSNIPFRKIGCRTPDIHVNLKSHSSASFPKLWATSPETPFDFQLNECEPGMNAVSYTFKPAGGITLTHPGNATYQWLTLSSSSTAKGVAVQVMNADGSMVKFNEKIKFTGYNKATGGSYRIPMKARYMRTGNITNGTANSAMEFIMHYE